MNEILKKIDSATHIVIFSHNCFDAHSIGNASAFYTFLLQKHKKVSWVCKTSNTNHRISFIPWVQDIKNSFPKSADLAISFDSTNKEHLEIECELINFISKSEVLYQFFKDHKIKINQKIATALYSGLLYETDGFLSDELCGTTFAMAKELIECGADFKLCNKNIMKSITLSALRLKATMFKNMSLYYDAKVATFCVSDEDMRASGATAFDAQAALHESLFLPHTEIALLLMQKSNFKIKCFVCCASEVNCEKIVSNFDATTDKSCSSFTLNDLVSLDEAKEFMLNLIKKEM